jgi:hypothetical protein
MRHLAFILMISLFGCGAFEGPRGKTGRTGAQGKAGPVGPKGDKGDAGTSGRGGSSGARGPQGIPGNIDRLIDGGFHCKGRHNVNYGWYELNIWVYRLSTKELYLHGRSDLHERNNFFIPDSASFFGDFVETASFIFNIEDEKDFGVRWNYKRNNKRGRLTCGKVKRDVSEERE